MINFFIEQVLAGLDYVYTQFLASFFTKITEIFTRFEDYQDIFEEFIQVMYFLFGKNLVVFFLGCCLTIIIVKVVFAIINLVGQFVP